MNKPILAFAFLLLSLSPVPAQDPPAQAVADVEAELPPENIDDVKLRWDSENALASTDLGKAEASYAARMEAADQAATTQLAALAKQQIATGDLSGARKCWESVLEMDPEHKEATAFFRTIGRLDIVKAKREKSDDPRKARRAILTRTTFQTDDSTKVFKLSGPGQWTLNGSTQLKEDWRTEHTVAVDGSGGVKYRIHRDMLYGRRGDSKWYLHGPGKWIH